jgi:hypothetical protein
MHLGLGSAGSDGTLFCKRLSAGHNTYPQIGRQASYEDWTSMPLQIDLSSQFCRTRARNRHIHVT